MLYLVGGCSRSGKSTLAERIRVQHGVPWFPLDALKMGLHLGASSLGIHPDEDVLCSRASHAWVRPLSTTSVSTGGHGHVRFRTIYKPA